MNMFKISLMGALFLVGCGQPESSSTQEAWDPQNDPILLLGSEWVRKFSELPSEGSLSKKPWIDSYWPSASGGIADRWMKLISFSWLYLPPKESKVQRMALHQLAKLSPAEKFDIINGNFDYPTVKAEVRRTQIFEPRWHGLCHGWAAAAVNFEEPKAVLVESVDGRVKVPLGSSDVKALLTYYQGVVSNAPSALLGSRCDAKLARNPDMAQLPECRDANAGAFHIVLTNMIGLRRQSFLADVSRDFEVWNHPIHAFKTTLVRTQEPSPGAAPGTVSEAVMNTTMTYAVEVKPQWEHLGPQHQAEVSVSYTYRLELGENGDIIGGEWLSTQRPDFLWTQEKPEFKDEWNTLQTIYEKSIADHEPLPMPHGRGLFDRIFGR